MYIHKFFPNKLKLKLKKKIKKKIHSTISFHKKDFQKRFFVFYFFLFFFFENLFCGMKLWNENILEKKKFLNLKFF